MLKAEFPEKQFTWPVKADVLEGFSPLGSPVHRGVPKLLQACDFLVPLNTPVFSMASGFVSYVKQDSEIGGNDIPNLKELRDSKFWYLGNRIEIGHENNKFTGYEHLAFNSILVQEGEFIKEGQLIARTGYTGLMAHLGPHLHTEYFHWFGPTKDDPKGIENYITLPMHWKKENILYTPHPDGFLWNAEKWAQIGNSRQLQYE